MRKVKTFLVDDEVGALKALELIIKEDSPELEIIGKASSVDEAYEKMTELQPELLYLDIQLRDQTGFDLLKREFKFDFEVIFITAYDQYAIEAFNNNALSYLLKPISFDAFDRVKQRALKILQSGSNESSTAKAKKAFSNRLPIPQSSFIEYLVIDEIMYIKADGSYCEIYLKENKKKTISRPLRYIEDRIKSDSFIRVHRSYLVYASYIKRWEKIGSGILTLHNEQVIPVSRNGRKTLIATFNEA